MSNTKFWAGFYSSQASPVGGSDFAKFVASAFLLQTGGNPQAESQLRILDLGCGNCRDASTLSAGGRCLYLGVDPAGETGGRWEVVRTGALQFLSTVDPGQFHVVYMRWFLHAVPFPESAEIFRRAVRATSPAGGLLCVEVRSAADTALTTISKYDPEDRSHTTTHKRWLYTRSMCRELAEQNDCEVVVLEEGHFSPASGTETDNPLLIRFVSRRKP